MKRRIFNAIAVLSAVLAIVVGLLWATGVNPAFHFGDPSWRPYLNSWRSRPPGTVVVTFSGRYKAWVWQAAYWKFLLIFLVLPAGWVRLNHRERVQSRIGHCARCGYDLRATPDRCPECGRVPAKPEAA